MQALRTVTSLSTSRIGLRSTQACLQLRTATTSSMNNGANPSKPTRRSVTIANDTGRVPWSELSWKERSARTTQQSANLFVVLLGIAMTGGVATVLYLEVFSTDSKIAVYNRAVDRVRADPKCVELLAGRGKGGEIQSWGQVKNRSSRTFGVRDHISSKTDTDGVGTTHMRMHFHVEGPLAAGVVNVHMTKRRDESDFSYHTLALDIPNHERVWLENAEAWKLDKRSSGKMFGVRWW